MSIYIYTNDFFSERNLKKLGKIGKLYKVGESINKNEIEYLFISLDLKIDEIFLKEFTNLKYLISPTTGLNHIPEDYCNSNDISIVCLKGEIKFLEKIEATPQMTLIYVLLLSRPILESSGAFSKKKYFDRQNFIGKEFSQTIVGIAGCGRVGKKLIEYLKPLKFKIYGFDLFKSQNYMDSLGITYTRNIENFMKKIDILVICIDYRESNYKFFNEVNLKYLKRGASVVNTSRGEVVDEKFLLDSLERNKLKSAALDVTSLENKFDHSLQGRYNKYIKYNRNIILTPHIAGNTYTSTEETQKFVIDKLLDLIEFN